MSTPILAIDDSASKAKAVANLLPCKVQHDGPVDPIEAYWKPTKEDNGIQTAYFRGRKLQGKTVSLPQNYRGVVMRRKGDQPKANEMPEDDDVVEVDMSAPEMGAMEVTAEFDNVVIWGHEAVADAAADPYVRGMEEWLSIADKLRQFMLLETVSIVLQPLNAVKTRIGPDADLLTNFVKL
ncbi:hypothetical protein N3K66_003263 [Trichothecium roseum]|uniref:Uncharacterized protein n=1 Tax=Trichothecium roseum TaxID=47278 RepID=A0ACC0V689_9HYPO|nr:hypothetical protein N3K66_003263 [Trichothecium roseum]